jgi:hypothetical protein
MSVTLPHVLLQCIHQVHHQTMLLLLLPLLLPPLLLPLLLLPQKQH